jgi:hypothetical protein
LTTLLIAAPVSQLRRLIRRQVQYGDANPGLARAFVLVQQCVDGIVEEVLQLL